MSSRSGNQGAPLSEGGGQVIRTADVDNFTMASGVFYAGVPTTARAYVLPALDTVQDGATIRLFNNSGGANTITVTSAGGFNDAVGTTTDAVAQGANVLYIAKSTANGVAGTWYTF